MMKKQKNKKGFTLIESLVLIVIFSISTVAFYKVYALSAKLILESKRRMAATELADERIEQLRNVPYDELKNTTDPNNKINKDEIFFVNGIKYRVLTYIYNVDDKIDGNSGGDYNSNTSDYKIAKIYVFWGKATDSSLDASTILGSDYSRYRINVVSTFVPPPGSESNDGDGLLTINVIESDGTPVSGVNINIYCHECQTESGTSDVNLTEITDSDGEVTVSLPPSSNGSIDYENYKITLEKSGYQTIKTQKKYDGSTAPNEGSYEPVYPHLTIYSNRRVVKTFVMDEYADFPLQIVDPFCDVLTGAHIVNFRGGLLVGMKADKIPDENIYALDSFFGNTQFTADAATGSLDIKTDTNLDGTIDSSDHASFGFYELDVSSFESDNNLTFWKMMPNDGENRNKLPLNSSTSFTTGKCRFVAMDNSVDSLYVVVQYISPNGTVVPIPDATVRLQNHVLNYVASIQTDEFGRAFFPVDKDRPLQKDDYDVRITKSGYNSYDGVVSIDELQGLIVNMTN